MRCREFRSLHAAYVDDVLSARDMGRMQAHRELCDACARMDTQVRRGLLVVRNLREIEPSADFSARLEARLAVVREEMCGRRMAMPAERDDLVFPREARTARVAAFMGFGRQVAGQGARALATAAAIAGVAAVATFVARNPDGEALRQAPVVAALPDSFSFPQPAPLVQPIATPVYVTPMPVGMGMVPAVMTAGQAAEHFATLEYASYGAAGYTR